MLFTSSGKKKKGKKNVDANLPKHTHAENYKMWMKQIKDPNKWRDSLCSLIRRLNIVKMSTLLKMTYRLNTVPITIQVRFFVDIDTNIVTCVWKGKWVRITKILKKRNKVEEITYDFKTYCTATVIKTALLAEG